MSQSLADPGDEATDIEPQAEWVGLSRALEIMLHVVEAELQVPPAASWRKRATPAGAHWPPSFSDIAGLLRRSPAAKVYPPPLSEMKARAIERRMKLEAGAFQVEQRDRRPLRLEDAALVQAHMRLMYFFQSGSIRVRAVDCTKSLLSLLSGDEESAVVDTRHPTEMSPEHWKLQQGEDKRKRGRRDASPVPDYREDWLPPIIDIPRRIQIEFRQIEVRYGDLQTAIGKMPSACEVVGGVFRIVQEGADRKLELQCAGRMALLAPSLGLGAIGILLSRPGQSIAWLHLDGAARAFTEGEEAERAVLRGEAAFVGDSLDSWPAEEDDNFLNDMEYSEGHEPEIEDVTGTAILTVKSKDRSQEIEKAEVVRIKAQLFKLKKRLTSTSPNSLARLRSEIEATEVYLRRLENTRRRIVTPADKVRQRTYRALESALAQLSVKCNPLAAHLGTLHAKGRRCLRIENNTICYEPSVTVSWDTRPQTPKRHGSV